ncbi:MAG: hypothetical protein QM765_51660 [Myxococcales bacterium]
MNPVHPQVPSPALGRIRVRIPANVSASETVNLTAEEMQAEIARLHDSARPVAKDDAQPKPDSDLRLYVGLGLGAALLAAVAFLIANPQLPSEPPSPKPLAGYAP